MVRSGPLQHLCRQSLTIESIANLITFESASEQGVVIGFKEHATTGVPVTAFSIATVYAWIWLTRRLLS